MKIDLAGKIKNTHLPRSKPLLPMFEAVVNAFQAIEDAGETVSSPSIDIVVERDPVLPGVDMDGDVNDFTVIDNGIGFNEGNLDSFFTSDTQYKLSRGGKGIGRFIWLKAFKYAEIESHYRESGKLVKRAFKFTTNGEQPTVPAADSQETEPKTTVRLVAMQSPYKERCPFLQHVLPDGFMKVRHCGFLHASCAVPTDTLRLMILPAHPIEFKPTQSVPPEPLAAFCPTCGAQMRVVMRFWTSNRVFVDTG